MYVQAKSGLNNCLVGFSNILIVFLLELKLLISIFLYVKLWYKCVFGIKKKLFDSPSLITYFNIII